MEIIKNKVFRLITALCTVIIFLAMVCGAYNVTFNDCGNVTDKSYNDGDEIEVTNSTFRDGKYLVGWETEDRMMLVGTSFVPASDMTLTAVWDETVPPKPGVNAITNGDFEDVGIDVRPSAGYTAIVKDPTDASNNVLLYHRTSGYASIQHSIAWEQNRPYRIFFRFMSEYGVPAAINARFSDGSVVDHTLKQYSCKAGEWASFSYDYTHTNASHIKSIKYDFFSIYANPYQGTACDVYFDDIGIIPYIKISYDAAGGSGAPKDEYQLDGIYSVSQTAPARFGYRFLGWALSENPQTPVNSVALSEGDITLTAIWEKTETEDIITYNYASDRRGISDGTITVALPDDAPKFTDVVLYYGDEKGKLSGYTPLAELALTNGAAAFTLRGSHVFPAKATRIIAVFYENTAESTTCEYIIPEERRFDNTKQPKFTYYQVSDVHVGGDYWNNAVNRNNAVADIHANNPDFVVIGGDLVENGIQSHYKALDTFLDKNFNSIGLPVFIASGNHEYHVSGYPSADYYGDGLTEIFNKQIAVNKAYGYDIRKSGDDLFYTATINGTKFIFLATPEPINDYTISEKQLRFLDNALYDAEKSNEPVFVISHVGIYANIPHRNESGGIKNKDALEKIFKRHPNVIFACGHTHSNLTENRAGETIQHVNVGNQTTTYTNFNDGCMIMLEGINGEQYEKNLSAGVRVLVYDDIILLECRKFASESEAISYALYQVDIPNAKASFPEISIEGAIPAPGVTLTAKVNGESLPEGYRVEWTVGRSGVLSTDTSFTLTEKDAVINERVHLRVYDSNGNYASVSTEAFARHPKLLSCKTNGDTVISKAEIDLSQIASDAIAVFAVTDAKSRLMNVSILPIKGGKVHTVEAETKVCGEAEKVTLYVFENGIKLRPLSDSVSLTAEVSMDVGGLYR